MSAIFLKEQNKKSRRFCILQDDEESGWLYLTEPEVEKPVADAFAYNRIDPILKSKLKGYRNGPPPICESHASLFAKIEKPISDQFSFIWSTDGESVLLLNDIDPIAMIIESQKYGYSKGIAVDGPWGRPWDQTLYHKYFAEHANSQNTAKLRL